MFVIGSSSKAMKMANNIDEFWLHFGLNIEYVGKFKGLSHVDGGSPTMQFGV